jgi:hypothetical protein
LIAELGDATVNEREALLKHAQTCAICAAARARQQSLIADLAAPPRLQESAQDFLAGVVARTTQPRAETAHASRPRTARMLWPGLAVLSVAAALALLCLPSGDRGDTERVQARGGNSGPVAERATASADVFLAEGKTLTSLTAATLHAGDRLAVRFSNPSTQAAYLLAFAIDSRDEVHWIFPAYSDGATNPRSLALAETRAPVMLPETVELDQPAPGALRVVSIVSRSSTTVLEVEKLLAARRGQPLERVFPESSLREWRCTWSAR